MSSILRLLSFLQPYRLQVALALGLGVATIGANVGLLAVSGYLISAAALKPLLLTISVPMYLVRFFGVSRALLRYAERLVSHRMTLTLLARLRPWFYARLVPLAPARLQAYRSGDLLTRIGRDIEELENAYLRVCAPALVALLTAAATAAILAAFRPALAAAALACLALAGLGTPLLVARLARGLGSRSLGLRAELSAQLVDSIAGMQDLLAFGQADRQRRRIDALTREVGRIERRLAMLGGLRAALGDLAMGAALWLVLVLAIPPVTHGAIAGIYLAFLVLLVQGSFEAVGPLALAIGQMGRTVAAGDRLFALADAAPAVRDPAAPLPVPPVASLMKQEVLRGGSPGIDSGEYVTARQVRVSTRGPANAGGTKRTEVHTGRDMTPSPESIPRFLGRSRAPTRPSLPSYEPQSHIVPVGAAPVDHLWSCSCHDPLGSGPDSRVDRRSGRAPSQAAHTSKLEAWSETLPALEFEHVSFAYRQGDPPALQDVSFRILPGSRVAVVGPSGAGKSTLAHLALRFWDPSCGAIRLGDHEIPEYALADLRESFAVVSQDTYVFAGTLRTNLLLARPDAAEADLLRAAHAAQLGPLLARLPGGLDSPIAEQGTNLSGGERQRLAIAHALLKDAPILILDEATANLDPVTERDVLTAIRTHRRGRTVLQITHRLLGMDEMDEILVLDGGRVVQRGTHARLRAMPGLYRQLCETQDQVLAFA